MRTIRSKLLLVYLLFTSITLAASFFCYTIYRAREHSAEVKDLIHLISSEIVLLNNLEMQFIVYDSKNHLFYEGAGSTYIDKHHRLISTILKHLKLLDEERISNTEITANLERLKIQLIHYEHDYQEFISKIKEKGFKDFGIEGQMRKYVHDLEHYCKQSRHESLLLTIRRNEKDYFLRKDIAYLQTHKSNVLLLKQNIYNDSDLTLPEKKLYMDWLDQYYVFFNQWVTIDREIGIDQGIGLTSAMRSHNTIFEDIIHTIRISSDQHDHILSTNNKTILITAISLSVVLSILLSIVFSFRFTKPLHELSDYINLIVKNNFSVSKKIFKVGANDEMKELFDNVNWMIGKVETYIHEIRTNELIIEKSEKKFRSLIENSNDAIALMNKQGRII
ncbi:MAG: hypothetical protein H7259_08640, partial [Cytophagales bacterium]|nr:hypothetical protein [Cytophaga sp.]